MEKLNDIDDALGESIYSLKMPFAQNYLMNDGKIEMICIQIQSISTVRRVHRHQNNWT